MLNTLFLVILSYPRFEAAVTCERNTSARSIWTGCWPAVPVVKEYPLEYLKSSVHEQRKQSYLYAIWFLMRRLVEVTVRTFTVYHTMVWTSNKKDVLCIISCCCNFVIMWYSAWFQKLLELSVYFNIFIRITLWRAGFLWQRSPS